MATASSCASTFTDKQKNSGVRTTTSGTTTWTNSAYTLVLGNWPASRTDTLNIGPGQLQFDNADLYPRIRLRRIDRARPTLRWTNTSARRHVDCRQQHSAAPIRQFERRRHGRRHFDQIGTGTLR